MSVGNRLLAGFPPAELSSLAPHFRHVQLEADRVLLEPEARIEHVFFPHSGMISLVTVTQDGESVEGATIGVESALGVGVAIGLSRSVGRAVVQLAGHATVVPAAEFRAAADKSQELRDMAGLSIELLMVSVLQGTACNARHPIIARLSRWLLETADRAGGDEVPLTQEFLAHMLGARRTTVTFAAGSLQSAGIIRVRRGVTLILDRPALERAACECYSVIRERSRRLSSPGVAAASSLTERSVS